MTARTRLAVLGSPISHSLSPHLHAAAYDVLGLPWTYEAIEVASGGLDRFVASLDDGWRGLSLTMPLKQEVLHLRLAAVSSLARETGSANTLVVGGTGAAAAWNTDVFGLVQALRRGRRPRSVQVLGTGATAASAVVAAAELGACHVHVSARSPEKAERLVALARGRGMTASAGALDAPAAHAPDLVISTLPGGAHVPLSPVPAATLLDVAYDPWPSPLATRWEAAGGVTVSGVEMLVHQAIGQIRLFGPEETGADLGVPLPREGDVLAAMREAVRALL